MGEDRREWEWGEEVEHIGSEDVSEAADGTRLGLKVCEGAVTCLSIGLDIVIDVEGIYVVEEGAIL